jgi:hypothetical protein
MERVLQYVGSVFFRTGVLQEECHGSVRPSGRYSWGRYQTNATRHVARGPAVPTSMRAGEEPRRSCCAGKEEPRRRCAGEEVADVGKEVCAVAGCGHIVP